MSTGKTLECISPIDGSIYASRDVMKRCDYLDPSLCWTGCKDTGRGAGLSVLGYHSVTRPKSYHFRKQS